MSWLLTPAGAVSNLSLIGDVSATTPTSGDVLRWNGSQWAPYADSNYDVTEAKVESALASATAFTVNNYVFNVDETVGAGQDNYVLTYDHSTGEIGLEAAAGGGASQLSDLSDVNTSTPTNRNVLVADGVDWKSRALVEADISDLGTYLTDIVSDTTPQLGGSLDVNGNKIVSVSNGNIDIEPHGTGNVLLGNFTFDADQTVGAGQDDYVLTYDNSSGLISLEAAAGGGTPVSARALVSGSGDLYTYSNAPNSGNWWAGNNRNRWLLDLSQASYVRLTGQVSIASASGNTPVCQVRYATSLPANYAATSALGASSTEVEFSLSSTGIIDSGWIAIEPLAAIASCYIALCSNGGNSTADPAIAGVTLMWK